MLHPLSTAQIVLASLGSLPCFGSFFDFGSNFGEQVSGTTVGSNFATLGSRFRKQFGKQLSPTIFRRQI